VREWTLVEFVELIEREGITCGAGGWTRPHDGTNDLATIEIIATADGATLAATGIARRQRVGKYLRAARPLSHGRLRTARRLVKDALRKLRELIRSR
jgi:hypothetical protein